MWDQTLRPKLARHHQFRRTRYIGFESRQVYEHYTATGWSIGAITRWLNQQGVATRKPGAPWERSVVWAMLRNPAYIGTACFGKTRITMIRSCFGISFPCHRDRRTRATLRRRVSPISEED
jgi:hypothetical protein